MIDPLTDISFQAFFNAVPEATLLVDDTGCIVMANIAAQLLLGYVESEFFHLKVEQLIPPRYREHHQHYREIYFNKPRQRAMGNGRDLVILDRSGQELTVDIGLSPITTQKRRYVLTTLNVTDRHHQAKKALLASEERLWLAKQAAALGIYDFDFLYNVVHFDEQMCQLWGCRVDEIITHEKFLAAIHANDRTIHETALNSAIDPDGNGEYHAEFRVIHAVNGSECWVLTVGQAHFESGRPIRLVGIMRDITERKHLEKALQIQRAETEALFKQQVAIHTASAIAHELNQPLTAISAYGEFALRALESGTSNTHGIKRALEGCVAQAQRAGQSLHELIAFLQKGEFITEKLDLNEIVMDALRIARSDGYHEFQLALQLQPDLPAVLANRLHIQKALVNLLRNAVDAMRAENMLTSTVTITIKTLVEKNMALLILQDNGPGVDQAISQRIFEPFFTTKPTGIGMGLSISRALIEANGGQLWIDPNTSDGAKFHFTLPFAS
jgi:two-component system, LuxR family, sensor kinase FixL